ncbi:MAG: DNA polymerase III subunit delta [Lentisphaeria bacterium]|nr:DNA polymerase III subunit delta [Lentisphaerota bacterium]MBO5644249.1 DNA polymerase III subunit delta [Lentisphaeria bacterium]
MGKLYIISGDDDIARKRRAREIVCEVVKCDEPEDDPALEIISGDSEEGVEQICRSFLSSLQTPPFLADSKTLWLKHFPDLEMFSAAEPSKICAAIVDELAAELSPELTVIIDGPNLDLRKTFAKKLKAAGAVIENKVTAKPNDKNFSENRRQDIFNWCQKCGKRFEPDAVQFLVEAVNSSSGNLANELEKLYCYTGNRPMITLADCRAVVSRTFEAISWEFTSAITSRNRLDALRLLNALLAQKEPEIKIMAMLSGEFQKIMQTKLAMEELNIKGRVNARTFDNIPDDVRAANPGNALLKLHPFRAFKVCESAAGYSGKELAEKLSLIRDASRSMVSGGGNSRITLEQLVLKLTAPAQRNGRY